LGLSPATQGKGGPDAAKQSQKAALCFVLDHFMPEFFFGGTDP